MYGWEPAVQSRRQLDLSGATSLIDGKGDGFPISANHAKTSDTWLNLDMEFETDWGRTDAPDFSAIGRDREFSATVKAFTDPLFTEQTVTDPQWFPSRRRDLARAPDAAERADAAFNAMTGDTRERVQISSSVPYFLPAGSFWKTQDYVTDVRRMLAEFNPA